MIEAEKHRVECQEYQELRAEIEKQKAAETKHMSLLDEFGQFVEEDNKYLDYERYYSGVFDNVRNDREIYAILDKLYPPNEPAYAVHRKRLQTDDTK